MLVKKVPLKFQGHRGWSLYPKHEYNDMIVGNNFKVDLSKDDFHLINGSLRLKLWKKNQIIWLSITDCTLLKIIFLPSMNKS